MSNDTLFMKPLVEAGGSLSGLHVAASETYYFPMLQCSHRDSIYGVMAHLQGLRYGTGDVTCSIQHSPDAETPSLFTDVSGASGTLGTGGTIGSPVAATLTLVANPGANASLYPFIRLKVVVEAATDVLFTSVNVSHRE